VKVPRPKPPIDVEEARRLHLAEGLSLVEIGRRLGSRPPSIARALRRTGTRVRRQRATVATERDRRLHITWRSMIGRCTRPTDPLYERYGARGVRVCQEWLDFARFREWALCTGWKPGLSLGLDVPGLGYHPLNCSWITRSQNIERGILDGPRGSKWGITAFGETKSANAWAEDPRCTVGTQGLLERLARGLSPERAITMPRFSQRGLVTVPRPRRRRRAKPTVIDWDLVRRRYVEEHRDIAEVARLLGVSYHTIHHGVRDRGWLRPRKSATWMQLLHGRALRKAWQSMRERCRSPAHPDYPKVGARGIRVVPAWEDDFEAFHAWALRSGYRRGLCLVRRDRGRDYGPGNCIWVPKGEVARRAKRRVSRKPRWTVAALGEIKGPAAWARDRRCAVSMTGLILRLRKGWGPEEAITTPSNTGRPGPVVWVTAFGETKGAEDWARDPRCRVRATSLRERLRRGMAAEVAITAPPFEASRARARRT